MKDWKRIAEAASLSIPDLDRVTASLDALEASFRPLASKIPHDAEPAPVMLVHPVPPEAQ